MFSSGCARTSSVHVKASLPRTDAALSLGSGLRSVGQRLAPILGAALLTACTQAHLATNKSEIVSSSRQASQEYNRAISFAPKRRVAVARKHTPFASDKKAAA